MKKVLAIFDFDGTLINGNSLPRFLWFCTNPFDFMIKSMCLSSVLLKYVLGLLDSNIAKEKVFVRFFAGESREKFMEKARSFGTSIIPSLVKDEAVKRLRWHRERKHDCILVSASIEEYLIPWAESMAFQYVLATNLEVDSGDNITGKFFRKNCKGNEKVSRIKELVGDLKHYETYAYGDSRGDREILDISDHPYYRSFERERFYP